MNLQQQLEAAPIRVSVPCRIDLGGTLDISVFYLPLNRFCPSSFNMALDMRTVVTLSPFQSGQVRISSRGFEPAEFERDRAPFSHPLGLMFAIAQYFNVHGVHIDVASASPPKSALGGSSSAAVAVAAALLSAMGQKWSRQKIAWTAHYVEASVAGVPCGVQDQLAAAYGGVNHWLWKMGETGPLFERCPVFDDLNDIRELNEHILVAYCGIPHESKDVNSRWVRSFINGDSRASFSRIAELVTQFTAAVRQKNFGLCADLMNRETRLRMELTPDVLDNTGKKLFEKAKNMNCGARFAGAGGGGCVWAIGEKEDIERLRPVWCRVLEPVPDAAVLDTQIDRNGIVLG